MTRLVVLAVMVLVAGCADTKVCENYVKGVKLNSKIILQTCLFKKRFGDMTPEEEARCDAQFQFIKAVGLDRYPDKEGK
jgi:hypothetical protein